MASEDSFMTTAPEGYVPASQVQQNWHGRLNMVLEARGIMPGDRLWHISNSPPIEEWHVSNPLYPGQVVNVNTVVAEANGDAEGGNGLTNTVSRRDRTTEETVEPRPKPRVVPPPAKAAGSTMAARAKMAAKAATVVQSGMMGDGRVGFVLQSSKAKARQPNRVVLDDREVFVPTQLLRRR